MGQNVLYWQNLYACLDELIVSGKVEECRKILISHQPKKIPREWAASFGELAFRAKVPMFALKTLHRFIYPENSFSPQASDKEKMVYTTTLFSLGAVNESKKLFEEINPIEEPEALYYGAIVNFYDWNYEASIPLLEKYLKSTRISPYRKLVGKVNLAAAHIQTAQWALASDLLNEIQIECDAGSYSLLLGNSFELRGQLELYQANYALALENFSKAQVSLQAQGGLYSFLIQKWVVICQCMKSPDALNIKALHDVKAKAIELDHWNSIRECDLFEAIATRNETLMRKVIMGTPFEHYRARARKLFDSNLHAHGNYHLYLGTHGKEDQSLPVIEPSKILKDKALLLELFDSLTQDFYKPNNIGTLFQKTYPEEKFNPFTSPARVLQLLRRLNKWFVDSGCPLRVNFKKSEFSILSTENVFVSIHRGKKITTLDAKLTELKGQFQDRCFSISKVVEALDVSKETARKLIKEALENGKVTKNDQKRQVIYRFATRKQTKRAA